MLVGRIVGAVESSFNLRELALKVFVASVAYRDFHRVVVNAIGPDVSEAIHDFNSRSVESSFNLRELALKVFVASVAYRDFHRVVVNAIGPDVSEAIHDFNSRSV